MTIPTGRAFARGECAFAWRSAVGEAVIVLRILHLRRDFLGELLG
jgi:plasmid stabilization system protein ParE